MGEIEIRTMRNPTGEHSVIPRGEVIGKLAIDFCPVEAKAA